MQKTEPIETTREYLIPEMDGSGVWTYAPDASPKYKAARRGGHVDRTVYRTAERHPHGTIYRYGEEYVKEQGYGPFPDESAMLGLPVRLGEIDADGFHPDGREGTISAVHQWRQPWRAFEDWYMVTLTETDEEVKAEHFQFIPERLPAPNEPVR